MEAVFRVKSQEQKNYIINYGLGGKRKTIRFKRNTGTYGTSDREEISVLLRSDGFGEDYELLTDMETVSEWLNGDEPDKITREYLQDVSPEGMINLASVFALGSHQNKPYIIREMLIGKPVTQAVHTIKRKYKLEDEEDQDLVQKYLDAGVIVHNSPWYKYKDESITRNPAELADWVQGKKDQLEEDYEKLQD